MSTMILWLQLLLLLLQILILVSSNIILPLSRVAPPFTNKNNPLDILKRQATASLSRAQHLCRGGNNVKVPLYPRGIGEYTVPLSFGSPPQTLRFVMDTGSSRNWFPCTQNYACTDCDVVDPAHIPAFIPNKSSSYKPVPCASSQCKWLFPFNQYCINNTKLCGYKQRYGEGNTTGLLVSETLTFLLPGGGAGLSVHKFIVGCSVSSANVPEGGITGFGRARESLPAQMGLKSFSYCMLSHDFDDNTTASTDLVLTTTTKGPAKGVHYTPFAQNPNVSSLPGLLQFYYVRVQSISVGGVDVKVPNKYLVPDPKGYGGTIVDSGTTFTLMEKSVFDLVFKEFQKQVGNKYKRDKRAENQTDVGLCYDVGRKNKISIKLPQLTFTFQGGAEMVLPLKNYFEYVGDHKSVLCMTIVNDGGVDGKVGLGPSIILGNYLQQDYYMEYDLENNQLGIRQQKCK